MFGSISYQQRISPEYYGNFQKKSHNLLKLQIFFKKEKIYMKIRSYVTTKKLSTIFHQNITSDFLCFSPFFKFFFCFSNIPFQTLAVQFFDFPCPVF